MVNHGKGTLGSHQVIYEIFEGGKGKCLCYGKESLELKGLCDSNMASDVDTRKSTSGHA